MQRNTRWLRLDVCDYKGTPLCNLYDSTSDMSGQAFDVFVKTERNGYKEISFSIPSVCYGEDGEEKNYRLDYLISDYKIKLQSKSEYDISTATDSPVETDWFFVSESKVEHNQLANTYEVQAKHVSQLLNTMNLDLEFSDEEGNNTGTIGEIAKTILEGTGWHLGTVAEFMEEDKFIRNGEQVEKSRSFNAAAKTGAFKMMSDLCEMFDAKPLYHGAGEYQGYNVTGVNPSNQEDVYKTDCDMNEAVIAQEEALNAGWTDVITEEGDILIGRTVDILPLNPFSDDLDEGALPDTVLSGDINVLELYYDKNVKNLTRTMNTDNMVTMLTSYGSFGDRNGACTLQKAEHAVYTFGALSANTEYRFLHADAYVYFKPTANITAGAMKWSALDPASRSYVYDGTHLYKTYNASTTQSPVTLEPVITYEKNYFPFIMDFSYYQKTGLFNDEMLEDLAVLQTTLPSKYIEAENKSLDLSELKGELARTASAGEGFLRFDVSTPYTTVDGCVVLSLNKNTYKDGIIYRSDYDAARRNRFSWRVATGIKDNGMAISGIGSVVYIVNPGSPTRWIKAYVKAVGNGTSFYYRDSIDVVHEFNQYAHYDKRVKTAGDDINVTEFPQEGEENIVYVADDSLKTYMWNGSEYEEINASDYEYGLNDFKEPSTVMLWASSATLTSSSKVFMFSADSIAGLFGPREDSIIANRQSIEETIKVSTQSYPVYFIEENDLPPTADLAKLGYGWYYRSYNGQLQGDLHFCWGIKPVEIGTADIDWGAVYVSREDVDPTTVSISTNGMSDYRYYYSMYRKMLYYRDTTAGKWAPVGDSTDEKHVVSAFASVVKGCISQEIFTKGAREQYYHQFSSGEVLPIGNYAFETEFGNYWLFTTDQDIDPSLGGQLRLKTYDRIVFKDNSDNILKPVECSFDYISRAKNNDLAGITFHLGGYKDNMFSSNGTKYISGNITVYDNTTYEFNLPAGAKVVCLTSASRFIQEFSSSPFKTPSNTKKVRIVCTDEQHGPSSINNPYFRVQDYSSSIFYKEKQYKVISCTGGNDASANPRIGIYYLMDQFLEKANEAYRVKLPALQAVQREITSTLNGFKSLVGDIYREGYWQNNDYVEGDEDKLYKDSLDNIKEISKPEATYELTYLDFYGSEKNVGLSTSEELEEISYPDIDISYAAHLVDVDIDTNCWAYIDKIEKCYDQRWKTKIEINTRLSTIGQQSFTDVLARIAEVANEVKANQTIYKKANAITGSGRLAAERLEGAIQANRVFILGGTSNWWTDDKGNIVFEAADGSSAMMLSGRGWAISNTKDIYGDWIWRYMATGLGLTADAIYTGYLSAERIEAGSITTDKLSASVGEELEISSNRALTLFATVDGERPAGSLLTEHPGDGDSWIQISAKTDNEDAFIAIKSGGEINIEGASSLNVGSQGAINIDGGDINITSNGSLKLNSLSQIKIGNDDFGTTWDSITNEITQTVVAKVGRTFVQLTQPVIGQIDPSDPEETVTAFFRGDRWLAVDPVTLLPAAPLGAAVAKYVLRSKIKTETEDFDELVEDIIDELNNNGTITGNEESEFEASGDPDYVRATVIDLNGADVYGDDDDTDPPIDHLNSGTEILVILSENSEWAQIYEIDSNPTLTAPPVYLYDGTQWVLLSPEDDFIQMYTQIKQNESSINLTARKTTKLTGDLISVLSIAADKISSVVGEFNSSTGRVSILEQTSDHIIAGVQPVGAVLTDGSYISIESNLLDIHSGGNIRMNAGAGMYLTQGNSVDPNNAITMTSGGMNITTKGTFRLAAGTSGNVGSSLMRYDYANQQDDFLNCISMTGSGMDIKTTGVLDISAGGGLYLYNTDTSTGDANNAIVMTAEGMNISTQGVLTINPAKLVLTTNPVNADGTTLASQLTFLSGRIDSTIIGCTTRIYVQTEDPYEDLSIRPTLKMGDYWVVADQETDWGTFGIQTWLQQNSQRWGDYSGDCPVYCWSGDHWVLINDPSFVAVAYSRISQTEELISMEVARVNDLEGTLTSRITQTAESIRLYVSSQNEDLYDDLSSQISLTSDNILLEVSDNYYQNVSNISITSTGITITGDKYIVMNVTSGSIALHSEMSANKIEFSADNVVTKMARNLFSTVISETINGITTTSTVEITPTKLLLQAQEERNGTTSTSTVRINAHEIYMATRGDVRLLGSTTSLIKFYDEGVSDSNDNMSSSCLISNQGIETFFLRSGAAKIGNLEITGDFTAPFLKTLPNVVVSDTKPAAGKKAIWVKPVKTSQTASTFSGSTGTPAIGQHACNTTGSGTSWTFAYSTNFTTPISLQDVSSLSLSVVINRWGQDFYYQWNVRAYLVCTDGTEVPLGSNGYITPNPVPSQQSGTYYYKGDYSTSSTVSYDGTARTATGIKYYLWTGDSYGHYSSIKVGTLSWSGTRSEVVNPDGLCEVRYIP